MTLWHPSVPHPARRPYQHAALTALYCVWSEGPSRQSIVLPTGTGKTRAALTVAADACRAGRRVLYLAPTVELINQPLARIRAHWPDLAAHTGVVQAARSADSARIVIGSVGTLARSARLSRVLAHGAFDLLVVDECHHSIAPEWWKIITTVESASPTYVLGLTATPFRGDGRPLGECWSVA